MGVVAEEGVVEGVEEEGVEVQGAKVGVKVLEVVVDVEGVVVVKGEGVEVAAVAVELVEGVGEEVQNK